MNGSTRIDAPHWVPTTDASDSVALTIGSYCVLIVDLLGQSDLLEKWRIPESSLKMSDKQLEMCTRDLAKLREWRLQFREFVRHTHDGKASFADVALDAESNPIENMNALAALQTMQTGKIQWQYLGDTLVYYSSESIDNRFPNLRCIHGMIRAASWLMLSSLANRTPIRGGISMGFATSMPEGDLYGPALSNAHHLESCVAQWPRIVIADELIERLMYWKSVQDNSLIGRVIPQLCDDTLESLVKDPDGVWRIRISGPRCPMFKYAQYPESIKAACAFAQDSLARFQSERNSTLASRYRSLIDAIEADNRAPASESEST